MKVKQTLTLELTIKEKIILNAIAGQISGEMMSGIIQKINKENPNMPYTGEEFRKIVRDLYDVLWIDISEWDHNDFKDIED